MLLAKREGNINLCTDAPRCLQLNLLYKAIGRAADRVSKTQLHAGPRKGIVIVEGPHVMADIVLMKTATVSVWLEQDTRNCVKRVLIGERRWLPEMCMTDEAYIDKKL